MMAHTCLFSIDRWVTPSKANVFRSVEVVLNMVLQIAFHESYFYPCANIIGIIFLVMAGICIGFEKEVMLRYGHHPLI